MKILTSLAFLLILFACGNAEQEAADSAEEQAMVAAQEAAYSSMMEGHDRVMPLMNQITQAQRSITEQLTAGGHGEEYRELLQASYEQLEDAHDGMMNWMNNIRPLDELRAEMDGDNVMDYVREQTREVAEVEADMKSSIATATEVLQEHDHDHDHDN
jgi:hypothetical protein